MRYMSLKMWLLSCTLFLIMAISGLVSGADASISDFIPPFYDPYWDNLGTNLVKDNTWDLAGLLIPFVPTNVIRTFVDNRLPTSWYDPFWDDLGPALIQDSAKLLGDTLTLGAGTAASATLQTSEKIADAYKPSKSIVKFMGAERSLAIVYVSVINEGAESAKMLSDASDIVDTIGDVADLADKAKKTASELQKMKQAAGLAQNGIGTPLLSPPTSDISGFSDPNKKGPDVSETSGGELYTNKKTDVWYIDAFSWSGDRSLLPRPAAPLKFVSGEFNSYGYNWIYLPYDQTGMTYSQGYLNWVNEYLASIGSPGPSAGVGLLIDEGQNGGGGW
jgi:hypothetical protein